MSGESLIDLVMFHMISLIFYSFENNNILNTWRFISRKLDLWAHSGPFLKLQGLRADFGDPTCFFQKPPLPNKHFSLSQHIKILLNFPDILIFLKHGTTFGNLWFSLILSKFPFYLINLDLVLYSIFLVFRYHISIFCIIVILSRHCKPHVFLAKKMISGLINANELR